MTSDHELRVDSPQLDGLARELLGRNQEAEDVAQDVWVLYGGRVPGRVRNVPAWLRTVVLRLTNLARARERQRSRRERSVARPDRTPSVIEQLERESQERFLAELVDELDDPYREVVRLRYLEDFAVEDIALRVGRSPATVRSQVKRGLERLRLRLGADPERRRRLSALFPLVAARPERAAPLAAEPQVARPALVWGGTACLFVLGFWLAATRAEREVHVAAAAPSDEAPGIPPTAPSGARAARMALLPEAPGSTAVPEPRRSRGIDVEGDVLEPDGTPVPGAAILVEDEDGNATEVAARSDAAGHYRLEGADRRRVVRAEAHGRVASERHLLGSIAAAGHLDLRLGEPLGTLAGRVLSARGGPVARAEVRTIPATTGFSPTDEGTLALVTPSARAWTAADGRFRLEVPPQPEFHVYVNAEGHPPRFLTVPAPAADGEVEVTLLAPSTLEGRVVGADGAPAARARLGLVFPFYPSRETTTDAAGEFRFEALPTGAYLLRLVEETNAAVPSCFVEGRLEAGERAQRRVELRDEHTVRGRALDGAAPLADWCVELEDLDLTRYPREQRRTRTAADGSFAFPSCSLADRHVLRLYPPADVSGFPLAVASEVRAGKDEVVLRAGATALHGSLAGRFESESARLLPVLATLRSDAFSDPPLVPVEPGTGAFELSGLTPGRHALRGWVPGIGVWDAGTIEIRAGERTELSIAVPEPGFLCVRLDLSETRDRDGLVATISTPTFHDSEAEAYAPRLRAEPGEDALAAELFPGAYDYKVIYRGRSYETRRVLVEPGETTVDTLVLRDVVSVRLHLLFERPLRVGETISLFVREGARERGIALGEQPGSREWKTLSVGLAPDAEEVRVLTSLGLGGTLALEPADIAAGRILKVPLAASTER